LSKESEGREFLKQVAGNHLPARVYRYRLSVVCEGSDPTNVFGMAADHSPTEGKVVESVDEWLIVKEKRAKFGVFQKNILASIPEIGDSVRITPWARRGFDGRRLDEPKAQENGTTVVMLGETKSRIPMDVEKFQSSYLKDLIDQIYHLKCPDGVRNLSNALVDFGGANPEFLGVIDPPDSDCIREKPAVKVAVNSDKAKNGCLTIEYDRGIDAYDVSLLSDGIEVARHETIFFDDLAKVCCDLCDDGKWKLAKVEVLKKAKPVRKVA
jgi:hypothetical protein